MGSNTKRAARAVLACALIALSAGLPASATGSPKLLSTSVDNGWGPGSAIAGRFDTPLSEESTASLADEEGNDIPGTIALTTSLNAKVFDSIVFTPKLPDGESLVEGTYTVTFVVSGEGRNEGTTTASKSTLAGCNGTAHQMAWSADTNGVGVGYWTIKVYASDRAGNRSIAAQVSFLRV